MILLVLAMLPLPWGGVIFGAPLPGGITRGARPRGEAKDDLRHVKTTNRLEMANAGEFNTLFLKVNTTQMEALNFLNQPIKVLQARIV